MISDHIDNQVFIMDPSLSSAIISPLSIHEQLYLKFICGSVQRKLSDKSTSIFIKTTLEKEIVFKKFVEDNYKNHLITDVNFSIGKTFRSVRKRIKTNLESVLKEPILKDEHNCQLTAYKESIRKAHSGMGMVLTYRQAKLFVGFAEQVNIPPSRKLIPFTLSPITQKEKLYLSFIIDLIHKSLNAEYGLVLLGASEQMQKEFMHFAKERHVIYTMKDLNLIGTINALVFRVQMDIKTAIDPMNISDEEKCQKLADAVMKGFKEKGQIGRVITPRQAIILSTYYRTS